MGGLILIVIIFAVWYYRHNKKKSRKLSWKQKLHSIQNFWMLTGFLNPTDLPGCIYR